MSGKRHHRIRKEWNECSICHARMAPEWLSINPEIQQIFQALKKELSAPDEELALEVDANIPILLCPDCFVQICFGMKSLDADDYAHRTFPVLLHP